MGIPTAELPATGTCSKQKRHNSKAAKTLLCGFTSGYQDRRSDIPFNNSALVMPLFQKLDRRPSEEEPLEPAHKLNNSSF